MSWRWFFIGVGFALVLMWITSASAYTPPGPLWHIERQTYRCAGDASSVFCHSSPKVNDERRYRVYIDGKRLWVSFKGKLIYECRVRSGPRLCRKLP